MKIEIEIDEQQLVELVTHEIASKIATKYSYESREVGISIRTGVDKAIKEHIYSQKDNIIDRVISKASVEIVKKGIPKLLEGLGR